MPVQQSAAAHAHAPAAPAPGHGDYPTSAHPDSSSNARHAQRTTAQRNATRRQDAPPEDEERIGPYLIKEEIGRGSFATVFRGVRYVSHRVLTSVPERSSLAERDSMDTAGGYLRGDRLTTHLPAPPIAP